MAGTVAADWTGLGRRHAAHCSTGQAGSYTKLLRRPHSWGRHWGRLIHFAQLPLNYHIPTKQDYKRHIYKITLLDEALILQTRVLSKLSRWLAADQQPTISDITNKSGLPSVCVVKICILIFSHASFQGVVVEAGVVGAVQAASTSDPASKILQQFANCIALSQR